MKSVKKSYILINNKLNTIKLDAGNFNIRIVEDDTWF